jgi:hypothetical protein
MCDRANMRAYAYLVASCGGKGDAGDEDWVDGDNDDDGPFC